jgi:cytochrome c peroxidase
LRLGGLELAPDIPEISSARQLFRKNIALPWHLLHLGGFTMQAVRYAGSECGQILVFSTEHIMERRRGAQGPLFLLVAAWLGGGRTEAAVPQVPSLPTQTAGYIQYAITNLPNYYKPPGPVADANNTPANNALTDAGATLGRVLFYDKRLSHNNGVACASCHRQQNGFSDPNQFSQGVAGLTGRHSPGLSNVGYYANGKAFWDERAASIEAQALVPIENTVEMGSTLSEVIGKLNQTTFYPTLFQAAFGTTEITSERIGKAIGQFERAMVSYNSKYDAVQRGEQSFTMQESQGHGLFNGVGRCNQCHGTDAHIANGTHNIGLDLSSDPTVQPGVDVGAGNGRFKAASLRNIAVRGRFMHDGRFQTLQEVVQFYVNGIQNNPNLDPILRTPGGQVLQLPFTPANVDQIVAFLNTLTDNTLLTSSLFSDPFVNLPGDYTGDGVVDSADYVVWRNSVGDTTSLIADGNGDLVVNDLDYDVLRQNFGRTWLSLATGSGGGSAVPEPSSALLVAVLLGWTMTRRRRIS